MVYAEVCGVTTTFSNARYGWLARPGSTSRTSVAKPAILPDFNPSTIAFSSTNAPLAELEIYTFGFIISISFFEIK